MFLLAQLLRVPAPLSYELWPHGPFSKDVVTAINILIDQGRLVQVPGRDGGDPLYVAPPKAGAALDLARAYDRQVEFVAQAISAWNRPDLEGVVTLLYVMTLNPDYSLEDALTAVRQLKDHKDYVTRAFVLTAAERLEELRRSAEAANVLVRSLPGSSAREDDESHGSRRVEATAVLLIYRKFGDLAAALSSTLLEVGLRPVRWTDLSGGWRDNPPPDMGSVLQAMHVAPAILTVITPDDREAFELHQPTNDGQLKLSSGIPIQEFRDLIKVARRDFSSKLRLVAAAADVVGQDVVGSDFLHIDGSGDQWQVLLQWLTGRGCDVDWDARWGRA
jgi:hypothetical protein